MDKRNRIFMVSGTLQAMMVLSLIEDAGNDDIYNNYAFIAGLAVDTNANSRIVETIKGILETGRFERIEDTTDMDEKVSRLYKAEMLFECEMMILDRFALERADELFMTDNAQQITMIMAGRAYNSAYIVHYGDGMGFIRSALGIGFSHVDEIRTFLPIDYTRGFSEKQPLKIMDKRVFYSVCDGVYNKNGRFRDAINKRRGTLPENAVLLMMQQFTEWRMMDFDDEISMYFKAVERNCQNGDTIVIKDHPRGITEKRGKFLAERLTEKGFNVIRLAEEELRLIPIELICRFLKFKKVICTSSTAGISLRYLYEMETDISVDGEDFCNYKRGPYFKLYVDGLQQALKNVDGWKMNGALYSYDKTPQNYQISTQGMSYITYEDAYYKILNGYYMKNRRLSEFFTEKGFKNIAVYGMSKIGKLIAEDLIASEGLNVYLLDRSFCGQTYLDKPIYYFDTLEEDINCVFVAITHSLDELKKSAHERLGCETVFCLADL